MSVSPDKPVAKKAPAPRPLKDAWRSIRRPLARSRAVKHLLASVIGNGLRLVRRTNRLALGSSDLAASLSNGPAIYGVWHGQHLMYPALYPKNTPVDVMVSRSDDAEINALVLERFGVGTVRGSGGRSKKKHAEKGGARALLMLKKSLECGRSVAMVADIPNGRPRDAGIGIITLARITGRPIMPMAYTTSRRHTVEKTWDKMTVNLPFGRSALVIGEPIVVPSTASEAELEEARQRLTQAIDAATEKARALADADHRGVQS